MMTRGDTTGTSDRPVIAAINPAYAKKLAELGEAVRPGIVQIAGDFHRLVGPAMRDVVAGVSRAAALNIPKLEEFLARLRYADAYSRAANWSELDADHWIRALELMHSEEGTPLAWVLPDDLVIAAINAADHQSRDTLLLANRDRITAAARQTLLAVNDPGLSQLRQTLEEGWTAIEHGLDRPAQATAAAVLGAVVEQHLAETFKAFSLRMEPLRGTDADDWTITDKVRELAVWCSIAAAFDGTWKLRPWFNRHATIHAIEDDQYTPANAVRGLLVATGAARELQFTLAREWDTDSAETQVQHRRAA